VITDETVLPATDKKQNNDHDGKSGNESKTGAEPETGNDPCA
jgi:hypothetical protein